jgi:hypothetical protein
MTYVTQSGRRFTLAYHALEEWAEKVAAALRKLGCEEDYIAAEYYEIREAVRA